MSTDDGTVRVSVVPYLVERRASVVAAHKGLCAVMLGERLLKLSERVRRSVGRGDALALQPVVRGLSPELVCDLSKVAQHDLLLLRGAAGESGLALRSQGVEAGGMLVVLVRHEGGVICVDLVQVGGEGRIVLANDRGDAREVVAKGDDARVG